MRGRDFHHYCFDRVQRGIAEAAVVVGDPFVASLAEGQQVLVGNRGQDAVSADIARLAVAAVVDLQARRFGVTVAATATVAVAAADGGGPSAPALARIIRKTPDTAALVATWT